MNSINLNFSNVTCKPVVQPIIKKIEKPKEIDNTFKDLLKK